MKKTILLLTIGFLLCLSAYGQSFKQDFRVALQAKDMVKAEEILKAWDFADANDPELYPSYFNFYTVKSQMANGIIGGYDKENSKKALEFITEGIERYPTRFDMRMAKIYMLCEVEDYSAYTKEVVEMISYSKKIDNNWKGTGFSVINSPAKIFDEAILEFQEKLFAKNKTNLYQHIIKISDEMIRAYPNNVQSRLNLSTIYAKMEKYDESMKALLAATKIEPTNAILYYNLAYVYNLKGDKDNAKKNYGLTIINAKGDEAELKEAAKKKLEELK